MRKRERRVREREREREWDEERGDRERGREKKKEREGERGRRIVGDIYIGLGTETTKNCQIEMETGQRREGGY